MSFGCASHHEEDDIWGIYAYDGPWDVEIWQSKARAVIPRDKWNIEENAFFGTPEFREGLKQLETGTRWTIDKTEWILWDWDWTNHTVIITRNELKESVEQAVPGYPPQSVGSPEP